MNNTVREPYTKSYIEKFTMALTYNIRLDHAFYLEAMGKGGNNLVGCVLPFSKSMKRWRTNFDLSEDFEPQDVVKTNRQMSPKAMIQSLLGRCKKETSNCGMLHLATLLYLTKLHSWPGVKLKKFKGSK